MDRAHIYIDINFETKRFFHEIDTLPIQEVSILSQLSDIELRQCITTMNRVRQLFVDERMKRASYGEKIQKEIEELTEEEE